MSSRHIKRNLDAVRSKMHLLIRLRDAYDDVLADMKTRGHDVRDVAYHAAAHCRAEVAAEYEHLRQIAENLSKP